MKGLIANPDILDGELDNLILQAQKGSFVEIPIITPDNKKSVLLLTVTNIEKGYSRVRLALDKTNYQTSPLGQKSFLDFEKSLPDQDDRRAPSCGKRIIGIDVKKTGEGMVLASMLLFLEDYKNTEEIKF